MYRVKGGVRVTLLFAILVLAVIFVNGWTDAPNAIAGCVASRAMNVREAVVMAGICNALGALSASLIGARVAETVFSIVDFGQNKRVALGCISAAMVAVVIFSTVAFFFGIPTSESHALMAGIVGAALGGSMQMSSVDIKYIGVVLFGLIFSTLPSYYISRWIYSIILEVCSSLDRRRTLRYFMRAQKIGAASSAFLHGAQDSQKFVGVLMLGFSMRSHEIGTESFNAPIFLSLACAAVMTLGTLCGGGRIIKKVGDKMVRLDAAAGTSSDIGASITLVACTLLGIPVSTTHAKTCAMMGAGSLTHRGVDRSVVKEMLVAWLITFPCCALLGFVIGYFFQKGGLL